MSKGGIEWFSYLRYDATWSVLIDISALQFEDKYSTLSPSISACSASKAANRSNLSFMSIMALFTCSGREYSSCSYFIKCLNSCICSSSLVIFLVFIRSSLFIVFSIFDISSWSSAIKASLVSLSFFSYS